MSTRVENALKEYEQKYFGRIGNFDLLQKDLCELMRIDSKFDIIESSFNVGFVMGIRYAALADMERKGAAQ